ncbi:MAG: Flp pilus assembly protein CpaB [Acidobacteriaceae bacterium]|nr:Flp pilus assembly protein CpaB [Acidobacteriaceae bacterium]
MLLALVIALAISGLFTFWLSHMFARSARHDAGKLRYVAPIHPMNAGDLIGAEDVHLVSWSGSVALAGAYTKPEDVTGKMLLYPIAVGEPILDRHISTAGAGLSAHIPAGMRALSLRSDEVVGVAGYLLPGTRVDVLVTLRPTTVSQDPLTSTVLQDAQVLTAGQKMQPDPEGKATRVDVVTLLVSPQDAERVVLASSQGTLHFVLRNGLDRAVAPDSSVRLSSLAPDLKPAVQTRAPSEAAHAKPVRAPLPPSPPRYSVQMIRGDKQSVETF